MNRWAGLRVYVIFGAMVLAGWIAAYGMFFSSGDKERRPAPDRQGRDSTSQPGLSVRGSPDLAPDTADQLSLLALKDDILTEAEVSVLGRESESQGEWRREVRALSRAAVRASANDLRELSHAIENASSVTSVAPLLLLEAAERGDPEQFLELWASVDTTSKSFDVLRVAAHAQVQRLGTKRALSVAAQFKGERRASLLEAVGAAGVSFDLLEGLLERPNIEGLRHIYLRGRSNDSQLRPEQLHRLIELGRDHLRSSRGDELALFRVLHKLAHHSALLRDQMRIRSWLQDDVSGLDLSPRTRIEAHIEADSMLRTAYPRLVRK